MIILISGSKILDENSYEMDILLDEDLNILQNENIENLDDKSGVTGLLYLWEDDYLTKREDFDKYLVVNNEYTVSVGKESEFFRHINLNNAKYGVRVYINTLSEDNEVSMQDLVKSVKDNSILDTDDNSYDIDFEVINIGKVSIPRSNEEYERLADIYIKSDGNKKIDILKELDSGKEQEYYINLNNTYTNLSKEDLVKKLKDLNEVCSTDDYMKVLNHIEGIENVEKMNILSELLLTHISISKWKLDNKTEEK